jgi:hypothetical protein
MEERLDARGTACITAIPRWSFLTGVNLSLGNRVGMRSAMRNV